ncbi:hypothetical protein L210DRAFT_933471 [Boletus edulis BED1]|uniref:Uncharacterized protein n=1 Tax=Boletus edulis BED1 TaxID=1328754 RepID=A0AAD4GC32_BOLED|nr:hypothetical protein L210DRAFT_933471 [Boletus edulis BED1]
MSSATVGVSPEGIPMRTKTTRYLTDCKKLPFTDFDRVSNPKRWQTRHPVCSPCFWNRAALNCTGLFNEDGPRLGLVRMLQDLYYSTPGFARFDCPRSVRAISREQKPYDSEESHLEPFLRMMRFKNYRAWAETVTSGARFQQATRAERTERSTTFEVVRNVTGV